MEEKNKKMTMAENIRRYMGERKLTRRQIAQQLGVPYSTVCEWVSGNAYPRMEKMERLAALLGVPPSALLEEEKQDMPQLTPRDQRDIAKKLQEAMDLLEEDGGAALFEGEPLDPETKELLRQSLKNQLEMTRRLAKQKFTPTAGTGPRP